MRNCTPECPNTQKMAFDVDEAYNYLIKNNHIYTIRPYFGYESKIPVHLHRHNSFIGFNAIRTPMIKGVGRKQLETVCNKLVDCSGFDSVDSWLNELVKKRDKQLTTFSWVIYSVELVK